MKNFKLVLLVIIVSLTSCAGSIALVASEPIQIGEYWRAEQFKDISHTDVKITYINNCNHTVTFVNKNIYDVEDMNSFKREYRRLTLPNCNAILMRHHSKNSPLLTVQK